jgi:hypothetical protein
MCLKYPLVLFYYTTAWLGPVLNRDEYPCLTKVGKLGEFIASQSKNKAQYESYIL